MHFKNNDQQLVKEIDLIIILNNDDMDYEKWKERALLSKDVSIYQIPRVVRLGECLNIGIAKAKFDDNYYSPYYLPEAVNLIVKTGSDIIENLLYSLLPITKPSIPPK